MAIRNSKVLVPPLPAARTTEDNWDLTDCITMIRNLDCLDGTEWHRYGAEFSRGRGMRGDMVRQYFFGCWWCMCAHQVQKLIIVKRDFVNTVQQHLIGLATAGKSKKGFVGLAFEQEH